MKSEENSPLEFDENALLLANRIYTTVNYSGKPASVVFPVQKAKFFAELFKQGNDLKTACASVGITEKEAARWLSDKKTKQYLSEICDRLEVLKGQNVENYVNQLWAAWRGETVLSDTQKWAGDKIGKVMGIFKERIQHESISEVRFIQQDEIPQLQTSSEPAKSLPVSEPLYLSDGGEALGKVPP